MKRELRALHFEARHRASMKLLRKHGSLVGYRPPQSDLYEVKFYHGTRLQWHLADLPWNEYCEVTDFWATCQTVRVSFA